MVLRKLRYTIYLVLLSSILLLLLNLGCTTLKTNESAPIYTNGAFYEGPLNEYYHQNYKGIPSYNQAFIIGKKSIRVMDDILSVLDKDKCAWLLNDDICSNQSTLETWVKRTRESQEAIARKLRENPWIWDLRIGFAKCPQKSPEFMECNSPVMLLWTIRKDDKCKIYSIPAQAEGGPFPPYLWQYYEGEGYGNIVVSVQKTYRGSICLSYVKAYNRSGQSYVVRDIMIVTQYDHNTSKLVEKGKSDVRINILNPESYPKVVLQDQ